MTWKNPQPESGVQPLDVDTSALRVRPRGDSPTYAEPVDLFGFMSVIGVALARGKLTRMQAAVAWLVARDSDGTTGTDVVVNADRIAVEIGKSERTVWVHFEALSAGGFFEQTAKPTRGTKGRPGRRARYRCMAPALDLGLGSLPPVDIPIRVQEISEEPAHETPPIRVQEACEEPAHESSVSPESSAGFDPNRLQVLTESSAGPERENCTVLHLTEPTSDGPTPPVVELPTQPQDRAREVANDNEMSTGEVDPEAERRRQLAALVTQYPAEFAPNQTETDPKPAHQGAKWDTADDASDTDSWLIV